MEHGDALTSAETETLRPEAAPRELSQRPRHLLLALPASGTTAAAVLLAVLGTTAWFGGLPWWMAPSHASSARNEFLRRHLDAECAMEFTNCTLSGCCMSKGRTCYKTGKYWASCEEHVTELTPPKGGGGGECTWTGQNCTDSKCCNDPTSSCYKLNATYAECQVTRTVLTKADVKYDGAKQWTVVHPASVNVRRRADIKSKVLRQAGHGDIVLGHLHGGWVKLAGEPGYMLEALNDKPLLKERKASEEDK